MELTFIFIIILLFLFFKKFRESAIFVLKYIPEFFDSLITKNKESVFKLFFILFLSILVIYTFIFLVFITLGPETIFWNFLSDFTAAIVLLYFLNRTVSILFNKSIYEYFRSEFGIIKNIIISILLIGFVMGIYFIMLPVTSLFPGYEIFEEMRRDIFQKPENNFEAFLLVLSIGVIPAFIEEILLRGILYKNFRRKYGITVSIIILTVIFYLFHLDPQMIFFVITGNIILCLSFEYTRSLVLPFLIHFGINIGLWFHYLDVKYPGI